MKGEVPIRVSWEERDLAMLQSIQRRVLWLATYSIYYANEIRLNPDGTKVGGHQASCSSVVSILTALYFKLLRQGDWIAIKPHASPVFHAIQALRGKLPLEALQTLRAFGGLQSYPSRIKDPDGVDFSTGSVGLGAVAPNFAALTEQYVLDHFGGDGPPGRFIALVGDGELDEGNIWEALGEDYVGKLGNILWIVDLNRQSLDRVVPDGKAQRIRSLFADQGWHAINLKYGSKLEAVYRLPHGAALRKRIDDMSNIEYQSLLQLDGEKIRQELIQGDPELSSDLTALLEPRPAEEVKELLFDLGGHDLSRIMESFAEADGVTDRPVMILAYTIKGWGLPFAGDPLNHSLLLTAAQMEELRVELGIPEGEELLGFSPDSPEGRYIARHLKQIERAGPKVRAKPIELFIPDTLNVRFRPITSSQEAFGNVLVAIGRHPELSRYLVTVSPDVAISTNLGGWINQMGVYAHSEAIDYFRRHKLARILDWRQGPRGQHLELGISENNFFLLLAMLGLSYEFTGQLLLPIGTLYDPFICRGLDSLIYAAYSHSKFIFAGTPSGVSLSPEGGSHQSLITPSIGLELPQVSYYEPTFAQELEWILLSSLRNLLDRKRGQIVYLRLSTKPIDQSPFISILPSEEAQLKQLRDQVNLGGYRLKDYSTRAAYRPGENVVHLFAAGVMVPEALAASERLREEGIYANVFVVTSPDMLYRGYRHARRMELANPEQRVKSHLGRLIAHAERTAPAVTVIDGHSHTLSFIAGAFGMRMICLGTDEFGQVGTRAELYRAEGIDVNSIVAAAKLALTRFGH